MGQDDGDIQITYIQISAHSAYMTEANSPMTKNHLLGMFLTKLNHIKITYASLVMWTYPDTPRAFKVLHKEIMNSENNRVPELFPNIECFVDDEVAMRIATEELYASSHRAAIKELLPLTKYYCHSTGQLDALKAQSWFQFWNILRNCWSHDMKFNFNKNEKSLLPVTWSGVTIDIAMNGKELQHGECSYEKLRELIEVVQRFVKNDLA